jgi:hypothetical protein
MSKTKMTKKPELISGETLELVIALETSVMNPATIIPKGLRNLQTALKDNSSTEANFLISDVVSEECFHHWVTKVKKDYDKYKSIRRDLKTFHVEDLAKIRIKPRGELIKIFVEALKEFGISIIETDWKNVDVHKLMKKAVWRELPFEEKGEKGFRDSLIINTFNKIIQNNEKKIVIIICNDKKILEVLNDQYSESSFVYIVENFDTASSHIRLLIDNKNKEEIEKLTSDARDEFIQLLSKSSLKQELLNQHSDIFDNPENYRTQYQHSQTAWSDTLMEKDSNPKFSFTQPEYLSKKDNTLKWETEVHIQQKYTVKQGYGDIQYNEPSLQGYGSSVRNSAALSRIYRFIFITKWKTIFDENADISSSKITKTKFDRVEIVNPNVSIEFVNPEELLTTPFTSGVTTIPF